MPDKKDKNKSLKSRLSQAADALQSGAKRVGGSLRDLGKLVSPKTQKGAAAPGATQKTETGGSDEETGGSDEAEIKNIFLKEFLEGTPDASRPKVQTMDDLVSMHVLDEAIELAQEETKKKIEQTAAKNPNPETTQETPAFDFKNKSRAKPVTSTENNMFEGMTMQTPKKKPVAEAMEHKHATPRTGGIDDLESAATAWIEDDNKIQQESQDLKKIIEVLISETQKFLAVQANAPDKRTFETIVSNLQKLPNDSMPTLKGANTRATVENVWNQAIQGVDETGLTTKRAQEIHKTIKENAIKQLQRLEKDRQATQETTMKTPLDRLSKAASRHPQVKIDTSLKNNLEKIVDSFLTVNKGGQNIYNKSLQTPLENFKKNLDQHTAKFQTLQTPASVTTLLTDEEFQAREKEKQETMQKTMVEFVFNNVVSKIQAPYQANLMKNKEDIVKKITATLMAPANPYQESIKKLDDYITSLEKEIALRNTSKWTPLLKSFQSNLDAKLGLAKNMRVRLATDGMSTENVAAQGCIKTLLSDMQTKNKQMTNTGGTLLHRKGRLDAILKEIEAVEQGVKPAILPTKPEK